MKVYCYDKYCTLKGVFIICCFIVHNGFYLYLYTLSVQDIVHVSPVIRRR